MDYLGSLIDRGNVSAESAKNHLSAISCRHTDLGEPSPCTDDGGPVGSSPESGYVLDVREVLQSGRRFFGWLTASAALESSGR